MLQKQQGLDRDPKLLMLPLETKQLMLKQNRRLSIRGAGVPPGQTSRPGTPSGSGNPYAQPAGGGGGGGKGILSYFNRGNSRKDAPSPTPFSVYDRPSSPAPPQVPGITSPTYYRPPERDQLRQNSQSHITDQLHSKFEAVLDSLNVSGKTRQDVLTMFSNTNIDNKKAILDKYAKTVFSGVSMPSSGPRATSPGRVSTPGGMVGQPSGYTTPTTYSNPVTPPTIAEVEDRLEGYEWVDRLRGDDLDKQFEKVLVGMRFTGYTKTSVMNSTQPHGKRVMIKQFYAKNNLPPPTDLPEPTARPTSPAPSRQSTLEADRVEDTRSPKTVEAFVVQLMDSSTSSKALFLLLSNLRVQLNLTASPTFVQGFASTKVFVPSANNKFTGLEALQHILARLRDGSTASTVKWTRTNRYADNSNVRADEIRLQILECLSVFEASDVINTKDLVMEVMQLVTSMDGMNLVENLKMRSHAAELGSHICLEGDEGFTQVRQALNSTGIVSLVSSLVDPFKKTADGIEAVPLSDPVLDGPHGELDASGVWQFRTQILEFIIAFVGSNDDLSGRMKLRRSLDSARLSTALDGLVALVKAAAGDISSEELEHFLECVQLYEEVRLDDLAELREEENIRESSRPVHDIVNSIVQNLSSLSTESTMTGTLILQHIDALIHQSVTSQNAEALILSERLNYVVSSSTQGAAPLEWQTTTRALISAIESVSGLSVGQSQLSIPDMENQYKKLLQENDDLKVKLTLSKSAEEERRQEVADLLESISRGEHSSQPPPCVESDSSKDDELRRLRDLVGTLARERDEALRLLERDEGAKKGPHVTDLDTLVHTNSVMTPLPKLEIPGSIPLKTFEWSKVQPKNINSSIWKDVVDEAYVAPNSFASTILDDKELSSFPQLFAKPEDISGPIQLTPLSKKVMLLEKNRAQHIEILLASLRGPDYARLTRQQIRDGILKMTPEILTLDNLTILIQIVPTEAEMDMINAFKGDPNSLANGERFIREIGSIPRLKNRLESIIFQKRLQEEVVEIKSDLNCVSKAVQALMSSGKFKKILEAVLVIGNYVNNNTFRGSAYGFEMSSLLKLKETKAMEGSALKDRAPTLLHYLARRLEETDEELLDLKSEIGPVELASRVAIEVLLESVEELRAGFNDVKSEISVVEQLGQTSADAQFLACMREFVAKNESMMKQLSELADGVERDLHTMLVYFGQEHKADSNDAAAAEELFKTVWAFEEMLVKADKDNHVADERALKNNKLDNPYSRRPPLTPLQQAVNKKKAQLKAVEGLESFSKRGMTVRKGKRPPVYVPEAEDETAASQPVSTITDSSISTLKQTLKSRKTLRRITKHVSVANALGRRDFGGEIVREGIDQVLSNYAAE
ncbi:hypothetical protein HDU99_000452 [Rhizoclosmatium hyalinum]|nr:hypothetical protein HDU99_000452 [Rhizoclosmatium hyalinum]